MNHSNEHQGQPDGFPTAAGVLLGVGLGGFVDGIVLHQILQWHHMLSSVAGVDSVANLRFQVLWDGLFHASAWVFTAWGLALLWRKARTAHLIWSTRMLVGSLLIGFGVFNLIEGVINHHILGLHHVNETAPPEQWFYWDLGFLLWGLVMLVAGLGWLKQGHRATFNTGPTTSRRTRMRPPPEVHAPE